MLNSKQRAYLRSLATNYDTIYQIGKGGVSEELIDGLSSALEARELIKIKVLENSGYTAREAAEEIAPLICAEIVCVVGTKIVFYRQSEKKQRIFLP